MSDIDNIPVASFAHVTKRYSRKETALADVSLQLATGQVVGLIGQNGAGKSTLINTLMGFIACSEGTVQVFSKQPRQSYRRIGYVPEKPDFHLFYSARKLLRAIAAMRGVPRSRRKDACQTALDAVGLSEAADRRLGQYSKGMLQRFSLAQSIVHDPDLLLMDEPMSGLDPVGQRDFRDIITGLRREGRTIFISSHLLFHVEKLCDSVILLDHGLVKYQGGSGGRSSAGSCTNIQLVRPLGATHKAWIEKRGGDVAGETLVNIPSQQWEVVRAFLRYLLDQDVEIDRVTRDHASLEDVFLEIVGGQPSAHRD